MIGLRLLMKRYSQWRQRKTHAQNDPLFALQQPRRKTSDKTPTHTIGVQKVTDGISQRASQNSYQYISLMSVAGFVS